MNRKTVAIINYNTPELTMAAIASLLKNGGGPFRVVVFDNSDKRPFEGATNITVYDNTRGQIIDFDRELEKYPKRDRSIGCAKGCEFGSVKHMLTVQKLWELLPRGFVLMESDVLIKKPIDEFFNQEYSVYGYCQKAQPHNPFNIGRMLPMLCWMNVPMLTREGARYFDPGRSYGLQPGGRGNRNNWYDTGAVLLEDILKKRPRLKGFHRDIREFVEHYGSGSWQNNDQKQQMAWIMAHKNLLPGDGDNVSLPLPMKVAVCAIGRMENRYADEWVHHYLELGVDKIFIYDNNHDGEERFEDVLQTPIDAGFVEIIPFDGVQRQAYEDFYNNRAGDFDWVGFFDFDEFVEFDDPTTDIHDYLDMIPGDAVVLNWRVMTDNGLTTYDPRPVKERFTEGTGEDFGINRHTKYFIRTGIHGIAICDPHCPTQPQMKVVNARGERVPQLPVQDTCIHHPARVDHYDTKTADEYINVKWARGTCCGDSYTDEKRKTCVDYFFNINQRTPEKEAILDITPPPTFDEAQGTPMSQVIVVGKPKAQKRKINKTK